MLNMGRDEAISREKSNSILEDFSGYVDIYVSRCRETALTTS